MSYLEKAKDIYSKIGQGQLMEAFEQYYSEDVVMTEPMGTREGKVACRAYEEQFIASVQEVHGLEVRNIASDEDNSTTFVENMLDVTFKDGNRVQMEQVAVQKWQGDHIVHERFYYDRGVN